MRRRIREGKPRQRPFLVDYSMPESNGIAVTHDIMNAFVETPAVDEPPPYFCICTAVAEKKRLNEAEMLFINRLQQKPIFKVEMIRVL